MVRKLENVAQIIERRKKDSQQRIQDFWANPDNWPTPPFGHVFLARGIQDVGQRKYGAGWIGNEPVAWSRKERTAAGRFKAVIDEIATRWEAGEFILKCWPEKGGPAEPVPTQWLFFSSIDDQKIPRKPSAVVASCSIRQPVERTPPPGSRTRGGELFWLGIERASLKVLLNTLSVQTNPLPASSPSKNAVVSAVEALWPSGIPTSLKAKDRNDQIRNWCLLNGHSRNALPSTRTIVRALKSPAST